MFGKRTIRLFVLAWIVYSFGALVFLAGAMILVWKYALAAWTVGK